MPGRMHCTAVVLGAAVDVRRRRNGPAAHRGAAKRRIQVGVLVHDRDELWRLAALSFGFCDRFLVETDFGTGCEEYELDAGCGHGGNDGLAVVSDRDLDPCAGLVAAAVTGAHGFIPCSFLVRGWCPGATRITLPLAERHPGSSPWQALAGTNARAHRDRVSQIRQPFEDTTQREPPRLDCRVSRASAPSVAPAGCQRFFSLRITIAMNSEAVYTVQLFIVVHADLLVEGVGGHGHPVLADYGA